MSQPKILILEDHPLAQQALATLLKSLGHTNIFAAANYDGIIQLVEQEQKFDILICTITAPQAPELKLLREINKHGNIESVLLINEASAEISVAVRQFAQLCGHTILDELRRPFSKSDLQIALRKFPTKQKANTQTTTFEMPAAKDIARAAHKKQFIPYFQPKVNLQTMEVVGAEILMRWNHPSLGILGPAYFIDIAKRFGHLEAMTLSILEQAMHFIATQNLSDNFKLAVNIDASHLSKPDFHKKLEHLLNINNFSAEKIILEITETAPFKSPADCLANLIKIRMLGFGVSVDDFGAGLSSLQRICEVPCTEIKLDMSFIKNLAHNGRNRSAVASMVKLSQEWGVQLVAEGIETEEQLHLLQDLNCRIGQGYFFSPPLSGRNVVKWIIQHEKNLLAKAN